MKKLIFVLLVIGLVSCSRYDTPKLNSVDDPFIVGKVEYYNETHSIYYSVKYTGNIDNTFGACAKLALPTSMYNIGDTITIK